MPTNTYVALDTITVSGSSTNSVSFTSIPQTYTDLVVVVNSSKTTSNVTNIYLQFNGDSGSNYSSTFMYGTGSIAGSGRTQNTIWPTLGNQDDTISTTIVHVMNYANTTTYKTLISRNSCSTNTSFASVGLWRGSTGSATQAINRLDVLLTAGTNFTSGSTISLYGIAAFNETSPKATGGAVTQDATYWYHTFTNTGNFVPNQSLTVDYLVIGGGGAGGSGGGAGAYRTSLEASPLSVTAQNYTVIVGAGGSGQGIAGNSWGTNGNDTIFSTITSNGGGHGGEIGTQTSPNKNGVSNGNASGGGSGTGQNATGGAGGAYGNKGGDGSATYPYPPAYGSGGGGGAGAAGGNGTSSKGGDGGAGKNTNATWATVTGTGVSGYYAGGGAGYAEPGYETLAVGGSGGGGYATANCNGVISTGSGGGSISALNNYKGGNGGSGIVIVRYVK